MVRVLVVLSLVGCGVSDVEIALSHAEPHIEQTLVATVTANGEAVAEEDLVLEWTLDGQPLDDVTGLELPLAPYARGQVLTLSAALSKGSRVGDAALAMVTIANAPPRITTAKIAPDAASSQDVLSVEASAVDVDGDDVTFSYVWTLNDVVVGSAPELTQGFKRGDEVQVEVIPEDGQTSGEAYLTEAVIIGNGAPDAPEPALVASGEWIPNTLRCTVEDLPVDPDDDEVTVEMRWVVDGIPRPVDVPVDRVLEAGTEDTGSGGEWGCEARALDASGAASDWVAAEDTFEQTCDRDVVVLTGDKSVSLAYNTGARWNDTTLRAYTWVDDSSGNDDIVGWVNFDLRALGGIKGLAGATLSVHVSGQRDAPEVVVVQSADVSWVPDEVTVDGLVRTGEISDARSEFINGERARISLDLARWTDGPSPGTRDVTIGLDNRKESYSYAYFGSTKSTSFEPELELTVCR